MKDLFEGIACLCGILNTFWFAIIGYALFARDGWVQILNPFFDMMVAWYWVTTPITWVLLAGSVTFFYAAEGAAKSRGR